MSRNHLPVSVFGLLLAVSSIAAPSPGPATPVSPAAPPAPTPTDDYEVRGFFGTGDQIEVSIAKKDASDSTWILLGKQRAGIRLDRASVTEGTAVINTGGRRFLVRLAKAKPASSTEAEIAEEPTKSLKDLSPEEKRKATEAMNDFVNNFSGEQFGLLNSDVRHRMASDPTVVATIRNIRASGQPPTGQDMALLEGLMLSHYGETVKAVATLPGKDGVVRPVPKYFKEFFSEIVPGALRGLVLVPNLPQA